MQSIVFDSQLELEEGSQLAEQCHGVFYLLDRLFRTLLIRTQQLFELSHS